MFVDYIVALLNNQWLNIIRFKLHLILGNICFQANEECLL